MGRRPHPGDRKAVSIVCRISLVTTQCPGAWTGCRLRVWRGWGDSSQPGRGGLDVVAAVGAKPASERARARSQLGAGTV